MPTQSHYKVLGIAQDATAQDILQAYRKMVSDVMPKYNLYPTSVMAIDKFRVVQDAYECLIKPETRAEHDATLRELAAEEQSLFGERKARRQVKEEEEKQLHKTPPPYVWNEDTNSPLFWTPGRKLIEGPKTDPESAPVAYFRRSSLDKQLVKVSTETEPAKSPVTSSPSKPSPPKPTHQRAPSAQAIALLTRPPLAQTQAVAKVRPAISTQPSYASQQQQVQRQQQQPQYLHGWQYTLVAAEYLAKQHAQARALEEKHRQQVENERARLLHDLEKRKRAVEKERRQKILVDQEVRRRLAEKEQEMAAKLAERMKVQEEMEREQERLRLKAEKKAKRSSSKQVHWDAGFDGTPLGEYKIPDTGPYGSGWWSEPELLPRPRHNVLRKRRVYT
ncbi:hypothetical protein M408DRAFT_94157 [Serendipita vermifera MAFF 305830]|uniref:J domain-containing protein n=2 Tax=Serendipita vermifera MAFF 305830 TaxID=933852 RepID=A0A0C3BQG3_SERVB|nr:hypothetical protein M408DRAFT_94157 [Serendipita vermifera MAFF 305830]